MNIEKFILYPLYFSNFNKIERLMIKLGVGIIGRCVVCGAQPSIIYIRDVNLRESCVCKYCGATNRQRQIAFIICNHVRKLFKTKINSLKDMVSIEGLTIYNTEAKGALHDQLSKMKSYICSEFFDESYKSGDIVNGIMHQDLMQLSFNDESIDIIVSSDVLEHVPNPYQAHREIFRVLKRGGRHIFTVPFHQKDFLDDHRAVKDQSGRVHLLKKPVYHLDPLRPNGILVYNIFSLEMLIKLSEIGFRTNFYRLHSFFYGLLGPNALVFEAIKE